MFHYKKISVIGCPGSGKSFLSKKLSEILNITCYHLDKIYWLPNWNHLSKEEFDETLDKLLSNDSFIIDGNFNRTLEKRFEKSDLIIFLDLKTRICLKNEKKRRGKKREDFPDFLEEKVDDEFVLFIKNFNKNNKPRILELINKYSVNTITLKSKKEINKFLKNLKKDVLK